MQHTFGKRCTGILIKATSPISCIISTSSPPVFVSFLSPWLQVKRQICLKLQPKPKIKASSISWDGCEHSLQRGNTPTRIMVDLGSISSLTTLLAAERWIIKNPPEHGNTHSAGRETKDQYTEKSKFQRGGKKAHAYSKKRSQLPFIQLRKLSEAIQHLPAEFFLSEKTFSINTGNINRVIQHMAADGGQFCRNIIWSEEFLPKRLIFSSFSVKIWQYYNTFSNKQSVFKHSEDIIPLENSWRINREAKLTWLWIDRLEKLSTLKRNTPNFKQLTKVTWENVSCWDALSPILSLIRNNTLHYFTNLLIKC